MLPQRFRLVLSLAALLQSALAFTTTSHTYPRNIQSVRLQAEVVTASQEKVDDTRNKLKCNPCEQLADDDDDLNLDADRREAAFAMMGTLWAVTTGISSSPAYAT